MARDLRKLQNKENQQYLKGATSAIRPPSVTGAASTVYAYELQFDPSNPVHTAWGTGYGAYKPDGWTQFYAGDCWMGACDSTYRFWCPGFCVMPGVTELTFEIWGGGGGGAGACNCQQGNPGGAGAYARKTLRGCDFPGGTLGGFCYLLFIGPTTCCSSCCEGVRGCKTYITGCGLSNFCADGGLPGKTCCCAFVEEKVAGVGTMPKFGAQCYGRNWGCYTFSPTGFEWCDCACGYGGDYHIGGKLGYFRTFCACGDQCLVTLGIPQPGGFTTQCTRYFNARNFGNSCNQHPAWYQSGEWPGSQCCGPGMPGQGAVSATSTGGSCCQGMPGKSGLVKITFK